jgi:hypothetical protein
MMPTTIMMAKVSTINKKTLQSLLTTNEPAYINHFSRIFEELWKKGLMVKPNRRYGKWTRGGKCGDH